LGFRGQIENCGHRPSNLKAEMMSSETFLVVGSKAVNIVQHISWCSINCRFQMASINLYYKNCTSLNKSMCLVFFFSTTYFISNIIIVMVHSSRHFNIIIQHNIVIGN